MRVIKRVHTWTAEDDVYLSKHILAGVPFPEIATELGVSISSMDNRRKRIGLPSHNQILERMKNDGRD